MVVKGINIKPNFAALSREYDLDWRTVKKYYEGKPRNRNKKAILMIIEMKSSTGLLQEESQ